MIKKCALCGIKFDVGDGRIKYCTPEHAGIAQKYQTHRAQSLRRGIEWEFTLASWWKKWGPHWDKRGRCSESLVMCRRNDRGPYSPRNTYLGTKSDNTRDFYKRLIDAQEKALADFHTITIRVPRDYADEILAKQKILITDALRDSGIEFSDTHRNKIIGGSVQFID